MLAPHRPVLAYELQVFLQHTVFAVLNFTELLHTRAQLQRHIWPYKFASSSKLAIQEAAYLQSDSVEQPL